MKLSCCTMLPLFGISVIALTSTASSAQTVDYLNNPGAGLGLFNFNNLLSNAAAALTADGLTLNSITNVTKSSLAGANALYVPLGSPFLNSYPLTNGEISVLTDFVKSGHSVIFQMDNGFWQSSDNDLFNRLGIGAVQNSEISDVSSPVTLPNPNHPILIGPRGMVDSNMSIDLSPGHLSSLGSMTSLIDDSDGNSVFALEDKNVIAPGAGAFIFSMNFNSNDNSEFNASSDYGVFFRNVFAYAATPTPVSTPEPGSFAVMGSLGLAGAAFLRRRRIR